MIDHITKNYGVQFPFGGVVCSTHYKEKSVSKMSPPKPGPAVEEDDTNYVLEVLVLTEGVLSSASIVSTDLPKCLDSSPVSALKRTRLEDLNAKAKEVYKKKHKKMKESCKIKFAEAATPEQEEEFLAELLSLDDDESDDRENKVPKELDGLLSKYQSGNAMEKLVILSIINHTKYTNKTIFEIFGCSLYLVYKTFHLSKEEWH